MGLNFETKDKFLTKLEIIDIFFIRAITYLTCFTAAIFGLASAFYGMPYEPGTLTEAQIATRNIALHHLYFSVILFFYSYIFLIMADGFSKKFGFIKIKNLSMLIILLLITYPYIAINAFPEPFGAIFAGAGISLGLFSIAVAIINTQHKYVQEYLFQRKRNFREIPINVKN